MEFTDGEVVIDKPLNDLDELILDITGILTDFDIPYAVVSGYIAVLFGRARATEDIDVIVGQFDESTAEALADAFRDAGYWGSAMPLDELYETLADELPIRIAEDGHRVPSVELKFASDEYARESLANTLTVRLPDGQLRMAALELQIAYKLDMGAQKDFEDALYLYEVAQGNLNRAELEAYVDQLGVEDEYDKLRT